MAAPKMSDCAFMRDKKTLYLFALPLLVLALFLGVAQWKERAKVVNVTIGKSTDIDKGAYLALRMLSEEIKAYPNAQTYIVRRGVTCDEGRNELITRYDRKTGRFHDDYVCQGSSIDWANISPQAIHDLANQGGVFSSGSYQLWLKYGGEDFTT